MKKSLKIGVLVSGRGSNLQALLDQIQLGKLPAEMAVVISDQPEATALERLKGTGIRGELVPKSIYKERSAFEEKILQLLEETEVELLVLAGFLRILSPKFIHDFGKPMINIHPSLLPAFPGLHAQKQALDYGVKFAGCTAHFVNEEVDGGAIILQSVVPVYEEDTESTLAARILVEEHRILPDAIRYYAEGRIQIQGRQIKILANGGGKANE